MVKKALLVVAFVVAVAVLAVPVGLFVGPRPKPTVDTVTVTRVPTACTLAVQWHTEYRQAVNRFYAAQFQVNTLVDDAYQAGLSGDPNASVFDEIAVLNDKITARYRAVVAADAHARRADLACHVASLRSG